MATQTVDFPAECREAFRYLAAEHAAIEPRGYDTIRARARKHAAIDEVLDTYAEWLAVAEFEAEL